MNDYGSGKAGAVLFDGVHTYPGMRLQNLDRLVTAYWHHSEIDDGRFADDERDYSKMRITHTYSATFKNVYWLEAGLEATTIGFANDSILVAGHWPIYASECMDLSVGAVVSAAEVERAMLVRPDAYTLLSKRIVELEEMLKVRP